ncbi:hypothetical protein scyTo_0025212 [Scyliorhinus torazame]|uniref:Uncharacterized protein n=1 Tax=Scyliorhinus torazame TaxID=75743 RepID=A0A401QGF6_SCYTO|nr:hypothetical protein [Scyliorhinus torazame]
MIGMINLTFGITLYYAATFVVAIRLWVPWWAGFLFVISGALTMWNVDSPEPRVVSTAVRGSTERQAAIAKTLSVPSRLWFSKYHPGSHSCRSLGLHLT